jgi:hypothetical protein
MGLVKQIASASVKMGRRLTSLQHVKSVHFTFDAFDANMKGQREFHRRLVGKRLRATNSKCEITFKQMENMEPPTTTITFEDGHAMTLQTTGMRYEDIAETMNSYVMTLALEQIKAEGDKYAKNSKV